MADYAPPTGPPPPHVPEGWKVLWNEQYQEWFYVNLYTKKSQWDKPTEPARPGDGETHHDGGPPPYATGPGGASNVSDNKKPYDSNNPYNSEHETDEQLARRLQAEEQARTSGQGSQPGYGASTGYYNSGTSQGGMPNPQGIQGGYPGAPQPMGNDPSRSSAGGGGAMGILGKLMGKAKPHQQQYPQQGYGQGYPQQGYYQQSMYPQQGMGYGRPGRKPGMGAGGAAALGAGGGLLGGMMLAGAMDGGDHGGGYGGDGGGYGGDDGGGYGGDDGGGDGGGDFGGDGGGDMGGGDF